MIRESKGETVRIEGYHPIFSRFQSCTIAKSDAIRKSMLPSTFRKKPLRVLYLCLYLSWLNISLTAVAIWCLNYV